MSVELSDESVQLKAVKIMAEDIRMFFILKRIESIQTKSKEIINYLQTKKRTELTIANVILQL
jgi:hypothetical protein